MFGTKILEEKESKFNGHLCVVKTWGMGTYIQANGLTQSGGIVESIWKQTIKKVKSEKLRSSSAIKVKSCLVLGLGGGTVTKLVKKNWPEAGITGVDIDPVIVNLGKKYLELDGKKVKIIITDAYTFNKQLVINNQQFDLIIVDLYQGDKFPEKFAIKNYIQRTGSLLAQGGIAVFNRLYYKEKKAEAEKFGDMLKKVFKKVESFRPISNIMYICTN